MVSSGVRRGLWLVGALALTIAGSAAAAPQTVEAQNVIRTQDDLPRHSYPMSGSAASLLAADDTIFNAFAAKVAGDVDRVLKDYEIADRATRRRLLTTRSSYEMLNGRNEQALATILAIRALEDKPDAKLTSGLREEAILRARIATGATAGPAFDQRFAALYHKALAILPFTTVSTRLKETKSKIEFQTPAIVAGYIANQVEPAVAREGAVSDKGADDLLWARTFARVIAPTTGATVSALRSVITANTIQKPDIWTAREVTLTSTDPGRPVIVAVWDSGVDLTLFPGLTFDMPTTGAPNNGHGLSFDIDSRPTSGLLLPLSAEQREAYSHVIDDFQGFNDSDAAIDSLAAERLRAKLARMSGKDGAAYLERLSFFNDYQHGTHVAGIIARGNPFVRLAVIRDTYDTRPVPTPPSDASVARRAALYDRVSAWLMANRVRVVNMSWGDAPSNYERDLEKNGIGSSVAERKAMARQFFETARDAFKRVLVNNPETLFVASAGNSNADTGFEEGYPSSLTAPNLLIVSAVDQAGDEASFTSNGRSVAVSANGHQVRSYVPGGTQLAKSGTSMAAPNVVNLAAKLIALSPGLKPVDTIRLISQGGTPSEDGRRRNINPQASTALLRKK